MADGKTTLKATLAAAMCALGLCGLERKYKLSRRLAGLAHSIEAVPFPGVRLYSFLAARQLRPLYAALADEVVHAGHFDRILDIGTGLGYFPIEVALRNPEACVSGIDDSSDMIQIAEANAHALRAGRSVEFATGEPTNLPFPGRYFDLAVSIGILHHWPDAGAVLDEVYHVLAPDGQCWICDYRREVPEDVWLSLRGKLPTYLKLPFTVGPMASGMAAHSEESLRRLALDARFEVMSVEQRTFTVFGHPMPIFTLAKLHKPAAPRSDGE